jgi:hypothetical protein
MYSLGALEPIEKYCCKHMSYIVSKLPVTLSQTKEFDELHDRFATASSSEAPRVLEHDLIILFPCYVRDLEVVPFQTYNLKSVICGLPCVQEHSSPLPRDCERR